MAQNNTTKLAPGHDQIWLQDFSDLNTLSKTAFILRQLFRVKRDTSSNIVSISDLSVRSITGFGRNTIARAKLELIKNGDLTVLGFNKYLVKDFKRFLDNCSKTEQSLNKEVLQNGAIDCSKTEHRLLQNGAQTAPKRSTPYKTDTETDKTDAKIGDISPVENEEISYLKEQFPFRDREGLKVHLMNRGYSEHAAAEFMERFYSQYTGKVCVS